MVNALLIATVLNQCYLRTLPCLTHERFHSLVTSKVQGLLDNGDELVNPLCRLGGLNFSCLLLCFCTACLTRRGRTWRYINGVHLLASDRAAKTEEEFVSDNGNHKEKQLVLQPCNQGDERAHDV